MNTRSEVLVDTTIQTISPINCDQVMIAFELS